MPGRLRPAKSPGVSFVPPDSSVKSAAAAVPPLSLITCLITVSVALLTAFTVIEHSVCWGVESVAVNETTNVPAARASS